MKLPVVLAVLIGSLVLACSTVTPVPAEPTPNIDATVVAGIKGTQEAKSAIEATVEARVKEELRSQPTPTPATVAAREATVLPPTPEPTSTATSVPTSTATSVPTSTATPVPTSTATPVPTQTLTPSTQDGPPNTTSYVLVIEPEFDKEVTFKIGKTDTLQTIQAASPGAITHLGLSIEIEQPGMDDFGQITGDAGDGSFGIFPPQIIVGTASIGRLLAPEGTVITAWQNNGEDLIGSTTVGNEQGEYKGDLSTTLSPLGANLINVMGFDNEAQEWMFYDPKTSLVNFSNINAMHDNVAYYINVTQSQTVSLGGVLYQLNEGLNIVPWGEYAGVNRLSIGPKDGLLSLIQDENLVRIWRFDNEYQNWSFFDPREAFATANTLRTLNDNEVIWLVVKRDVYLRTNGTSLNLHGFSHGNRSTSGSNLIIWRHGPIGPSKDLETSTAATPVPSAATSFGDGTWIVGSNIQPGTYRSSRTGGGCYWERLSGFSGGFGDIIANEITDELSLVEISSTDAGFSTQDCGTWKKATTRITSSLTSPFGDGAFIVGLDIASGTWRSPGGDSCYWERLSGFSGEFKHIEANDVGVFNNIVTIQSTDKGFSSSDCGTWTKTS